MNSLTTAFTVRLIFLSDWHIGTGEGRVGHLDAQVHRDEDDLPFVPAKSLTGVWRDACETVARSLDRVPFGAGPGQGPWGNWVEWIFGTTGEPSPGEVRARPTVLRPAAVAIGSGRLTGPLRRAIRGNPDLVEATVLLRAGVELDPVSGTARDQHLRLEERATCGLELLATVELMRSDQSEFPVPAELLLRAGARLVEGVGGKRNRGSGRVSLLMPGAVSRADDEQASSTPEDDRDPRLVELLADTDLLDNPGPLPGQARPPAALPAHTSAGDRVTTRLVLKVLSPVVVSDRLRGNVLTTRGEVTGTMLLPALLERLSRPHGRGQQRLGLGDLRIGDAVPAVEVSPGRYEPAFRAPMTWFRADKGRGPELINVSDQVPDPQQRAKPAFGRFARSGTGNWQQAEERVLASTHAAISDEHRRPVESAGGGLYTFLGISPGTVLISDVVLPSDATFDLAAGQTLRLGRSRKDGFGLVEVLSVQPRPMVTERPRPAGPDGRIRVWCVSDVLIRDHRLAPDPTPHGLARELSQALGLSLRVVIDDDPGAGDQRRLRATITSAARRESFAVRWGRPRQTLVALRAGSVITLESVVGTAPDAALIKALERDGIGERTTEGFGQVRFDAPEVTTGAPGLVVPPTVDGSYPDASKAATESLDLRSEADRLETVAWRRAIRREITQLIADELRRKSLLPLDAALTWSQLGGLRAMVDAPADDVLAWFDGIKNSKVRGQKWSSPMFDAGRALLLSEINGAGALAGDPARLSLWQALNLDGERPRLVLAPGREPLLRGKLLGEARALLLLELLRQHRADEREVQG